MTVRRALLIVACLPLAGCAYEAGDAFAIGAVALVSVFVASLFVIPILQSYLFKRDHHDRMYNRMPFTRPDPNAPPRRSRRRKG